MNMRSIIPNITNHSVCGKVRRSVAIATTNTKHAPQVCLSFLPSELPFIATATIVHHSETAGKLCAAARVAGSP